APYQPGVNSRCDSVSRDAAGGWVSSGRKRSPADETSIGGPAEYRAMLRWPTRLERRIAGRYLRSRRAKRAASLNTIIATGGVAVGVMALIVVLGVMNGLRDDLRERILVANPHLRILTFGTGLRLDNWREVIEQVRKEPGVVAAAPEVISQSLISAGSDYAEGVQIVGFDPDTGTRSVTSLPQAL